MLGSGWHTCSCRMSLTSSSALLLQVVSVDCNPAQSALLELKKVAIQQLEFEDVWQVRGSSSGA